MLCPPASCERSKDRNRRRPPRTGLLIAGSMKIASRKRSLAPTAAASCSRAVPRVDDTFAAAHELPLAALPLVDARGAAAAAALPLAAAPARQAGAALQRPAARPRGGVERAVAPPRA